MAGKNLTGQAVNMGNYLYTEVYLGTEQVVNLNYTLRDLQKKQCQGLAKSMRVQHPAIDIE